MSASQTPSPGQTPNAALPAFMRRRRQPVNPLVRPKRPPPPRPATIPQPVRPAVNGISAINGASGPHNGAPQNQPQSINSALPRMGDSQEEFVDYPIITTRREMLEGYRHHVMRFLPNASAQVKNVDPADETQFVRPVKLHRRDPRANNTPRWGDGPAAPGNTDVRGNVVDEVERERLEKLRAERRAERESNQSQMAPVTKTAPAATKGKHFQKKTEQVFQVNDVGNKRKAVQLRYEEAVPWHVEDFDNKNTWAGTYESALSDCHIMLIPEGVPGNTVFRMVPLEKWYKFMAKNLFKALSIDEAEARMSKKVKDPRWFMETQKASEQKQKDESFRKGGNKLFTRTGERGETRVKNAGDEEKPEVVVDGDDIDYNYEEAFADDEENALFGGDDEENKEAEEKIKREQREANIFELKEEKDYDKEEEDEKRKAVDQKKLSKKVQRALMNREKNYVYESDSEGNPYSSESESDDSETERLKEEERKKAEEQDKGKAPATDKLASAPSSVKGVNTPPRSKPTDSVRKGILKRSGSPNLSEASGSESSRKKLKKKHVSSQAPISNAALGASISRPHSPATGGPISRPHSPVAGAPPAKPSNLSKHGVGAGSTSDGEASDYQRQAKKLKVRLGMVGKASRPTSPNGSRAASPAPAMSPDEEIRSRIPPEGISLKDLMKGLRSVKANDPEFPGLIKANSRFDNATKLLFPKK